MINEKIRQYQKEYRQKNKEKLAEYQRQYQKKNKEKISKNVSIYGKKWYQVNKKRRLKKSKEWCKNNRERVVEIVQKYVRNNKEKVAKYNKQYGASLAGFFRRYRYRAKKAGYAIDITLNDFENITSLPCKYCGENKRQRGIDRVDNKIGYLKINCVSCCGICNMMKMKLSREEFLNHINKIYKWNNI